MTTPGPRPAGKSIPRPATGPRAAEPAAPGTAEGEPKGAAEGVRSAVGSHLDTVTISGICPGLQVQFTHPPIADWLCACGHHERARGRAAVIELTTRVTVGLCPHVTTAQEGRDAA